MSNVLNLYTQGDPERTESTVCDAQGGPKTPVRAHESPNEGPNEMTEFEHWRASALRYETDASYTDWLEGRSERLRGIEKCFALLRQMGCDGIVVAERGSE